VGSGAGLVPKMIPSDRELLTGRAQIEGVRDPRISDLLGRRAVKADVAWAYGPAPRHSPAGHSGGPPAVREAV
jgi:hypothetical protein